MFEVDARLGALGREANLDFGPVRVGADAPVEREPVRRIPRGDDAPVVLGSVGMALEQTPAFLCLEDRGLDLLAADRVRLERPPESIAFVKR
jgi:hypothetical protein